MKKNLFLFMITVLCLALVGCGNNVSNVSLWENAVYSADVELGNGAKSIEVEVQTEEKNITFTIKTDKETVGEALTEHNLISGENGAYGLYVKVVNGIEADYDKNQCFWSFYKNGEGLMTGVDNEKIEDGAHYEIVYTK